MIPVSVLVMTKNEAGRIRRCLGALEGFSEVVVVDSNSTDETAANAREMGARVVNFTWNGKYPKKFQWSLDNLRLKHEWILFVDADEEVTQALKNEIAALFAKGPEHNGYFVRGRYVWQGKILAHGLHNNKLVLFDRRQIAFPEVNDLGLPGIGEIEGHYQPTLKSKGSLGQIKAPMLHHACENIEAWRRRHEGYAAWEAGMNARKAWPDDRRLVKKIFHALPFRGDVAFLHSYILKKGFLDGREGLDFALSRRAYYRMVSRF